MKRLKIKITGVAPLVMNNPRGINPLLEMNKRKKEFTSKRKKTEDDLQTIADMEWRIGLYEENGVVVVPSRCIKASWVNGAKVNKKGKDTKAVLFIPTANVPLNYNGPKTIDELSQSTDHKLVANVVVNRAAIMKTRPVFNEWSLEFEAILTGDKIDIEEAKIALENAGMYVGICDWRPDHGRFEIETFEEI